MAVQWMRIGLEASVKFGLIFAWKSIWAPTRQCGGGFWAGGYVNEEAEAPVLSVRQDLPQFGIWWPLPGM